MSRVLKVTALVLLVVLLSVATRTLKSVETRTLKLEKEANDAIDDSLEEGKVDLVELLRDARVECAKIETTKPSDFKLCIDDVMLTKETGLAGLWPQPEEDHMSKEAKLLRKARIACAPVQEEEGHQKDETQDSEVAESKFEKCVKDVVRTEDESKAQQWVGDGSQRKLRGSLTRAD